MKHGLYAAVVLVTFAASGSSAADRTVASTRVEITLTKDHKPGPVLLRAQDGRAFEFSLTRVGSPGFYDMTLLRPGHRPSARNLLEPKGNWHGLEPFEVSARPASDPSSDMAVYGAKRDIPVRNYPLRLHVEVGEIEREDGTDAVGSPEPWFKKLVLTAELRPLK